MKQSYHRSINSMYKYDTYCAGPCGGRRHIWRDTTSGYYFISNTCRGAAIQEFSGLEEDTITTLYNPKKLGWWERWTGRILYEGQRWQW